MLDADDERDLRDLAELRQDVALMEELNPDREPALGGFSPAELEDAWWKLVIFTATARTVRKREIAHACLQLFHAMGLVRPGADGLQLMWRASQGLQ